jgi:hypothetical protein
MNDLDQFIYHSLNIALYNLPCYIVACNIHSVIVSPVSRSDADARIHTADYESANLLMQV